MSLNESASLRFYESTSSTLYEALSPRVHETHDSHEARSHEADSEALHWTHLLRGSLRDPPAPSLSKILSTEPARSNALYETRPLQGSILSLLATKVSTELARPKALLRARSLQGSPQDLNAPRLSPMLAPRLFTWLSLSEALYEDRSEALYDLVYPMEPTPRSLRSGVYIQMEI